MSVRDSIDSEGLVVPTKGPTHRVFLKKIQLAARYSKTTTLRTSVLNIFDTWTADAEDNCTRRSPEKIDPKVSFKQRLSIKSGR